MTVPNQEVQAQQQSEKPNDKEYNFRALEAKLQQERNEKIQAKKEAEEARKLYEEAVSKKSLPTEEDDDYSEPYVDEKRLNKKLNRFGENTKKEFKNDIQTMRREVKEELKQEMYLEQNPDFAQTLQHADKFAEKNPRLAESILRMPEGFERQRLVYENIKALGLDRPEQKTPTIQDKIDSNRKSPYYQPSGVANAPYAAAGDFSPVGQKAAYEKMQQLKKQLRI